MTPRRSMAEIVDLVIEDPRWAAHPLQDLAEQAASAALAGAGIARRDVEIACLACDDARIATLNAEFREKPQPTNVLSWPALPLRPDAADLPPPAAFPLALGDIAISLDTVAREAAESGIPINDHILHLILHATLHLLGYDHQAEGEATRMEEIEIRALAEMGIPSPY